MTIHTVFLALFGGSDDEEELSELASILGSDPTEVAVKRELRSLAEELDAAYARTKGDLRADERVPPDASPRRKAEALRRAVDGRRTAGGTDDRDPGDVAVGAAADVRDRTRPSSPLAQRLLDQLSGSRAASPERVEETLADAVSELDQCDRHRSALDRLDAGAGIDSVSGLVDAYRTLDREHRSDESDRDRLADAVETLIDEIDGVDADEDETLERRVRSATREVRQSDSGGSQAADDAVETAVARARTEANPRSRRARELFDALEGGDGDAVASALAAAAVRLDEAATTDALLDGVEADEVASVAASVASDLEGTDNPVAAALRERATDLSDRLNRVDDSNRVVPFAAREELEFYRRTVVDRLTGGATSEPVSSGSDVDTRLERLRQRREAVERDYVDARSDHNHSIPLYFLALVDTTFDAAADHAEAGRDERAAGSLEVVEGLIDHVEGLYERNQYSVMLRSLRG